MTDLAPARRRRGRFWLYAPFGLLALVAVAWSGFWVFVKGKVETTLDSAMAREAGNGRNWVCAERSVGGFPFRIEVRCGALTLTSSRWGEAVRLQTGPSVAVGQIYTPGLVIMQVTGPLQASLPEGRKLDLAWTRLEASIAAAGLTLDRFALVVTGPNGTLTTPGRADETWRAAQFEAHLRRNPARPASDQAVDLALSAKGAVLPGLDALLGSSDAGDLDLQASLTQSLGFRAGFNPDALEAWRSAGGQLEIIRLVTTRGPARLEASGRLLLDQTHRISGQLQAAIAGVDRIAGIRIGGIAAGLGSLFGGRQAAPAPGAPGLTPLPPLVLREGRVYLGPLRLPLEPLAPLY